MASAIDTATADPHPAPDHAPEPAPRPPADHPVGRQAQTSPLPSRSESRPRLSWLNWLRRFRWRAVSPLTRRIIAVNVLPLALLAVGFLYLGKFESSRIGQQDLALIG